MTEEIWRLWVREFFGVPADRLATAEFEDLLQNELANPERFRAVETKIRYAGSGLRPVQDLEAAKEVEVISGKAVEPKETDDGEGG
jgi:hypothetical protein